MQPVVESTARSIPGPVAPVRTGATKRTEREMNCAESGATGGLDPTVHPGYRRRMDDDAELKAWRRAQRQRLLALRIALPPDQHRAASQAITDRLLAAFPSLHERGVIAGYWPWKAEFDPRHALRHWRERGARLALPVVVAKGAPLQFRAWWPGAPMTRGLFDMPVPDGTELLTPQALLMPPVGFDAQLFRLGYGGGFYDRTLAGLPAATLKIGVAFELSRMATVRPQAHDIGMDCIVTEVDSVVAGEPSRRVNRL